MSDSAYDKFIRSKINFSTILPLDQQYGIPTLIRPEESASLLTAPNIDSARNSMLCQYFNNMILTPTMGTGFNGQAEAPIPTITMKERYSVKTIPKSQTIVYYEVTASLATNDPTNKVRYHTRSTIEKVSNDELQKYIFILSFPIDYVGGGPSRIVQRCNITMGAKWIYEYLLSKGFTVTKLNTDYILEYKEMQAIPASFNINENATKYVNYIKNKFKVIDSLEQAYENRTYGKGIDVGGLLQLLTNDTNINSIRNSIIQYLQWKRKQYIGKLDSFKLQIDKQEEVFKRAGLTLEERKEQNSSSAVNKLIMANLSYIIGLVDNKISQLNTMDLNNLKNDYRDAILNDKNGLTTILDINIVNNIANIISTLVRGYQAFSTSFQNIVITGQAGVGKSTLAYKISYIYRKLGILCTDIVMIVSRSDLVGNYLGQTAPKTNRVLVEALEGILFIDEAYQIGGCPEPDQYGAESLTEIVNFLDKNIGISIVIVAGYQKELESCFFDRNEGLRRRFPTKYALKPFSSLQLLKVFLTKVFESLGYNPFDDTSIDLTYIIINNMNTSNYVPNMGGDMLIMASNFIVVYLSSGDITKSLLDASYIYCTRDHDENTCNTFTNSVKSQASNQ